MKLPRPSPLSLAVQEMHLRRRFPDGQGRVTRNKIVWLQSIRPHWLAHTYQCRLEHMLGGYPSVYCVEPRLSELAAGRTLPHVYTRTEPISLCMFMHNRECWRDDMILANVVVPLAFYWLSNFEDWLFSGEWRGGGTHPITPEPPKQLPVFPGEQSIPAFPTNIDNQISIA